MSQNTTRTVPLRVHDQLVREGLHPVLARVCAARGIIRRGELEDALSGLIPPSDLMNASPPPRCLPPPSPPANTCWSSAATISNGPPAAPAASARSPPSAPTS